MLIPWPVGQGIQRAVCRGECSSWSWLQGTLPLLEYARIHAHRRIVCPPVADIQQKYAWKGQEVTPEISVGLQEAVESGEVDEKDIAFGDSFSLNVHLYTSMTAHEQ